MRDFHAIIIAPTVLVSFHADWRVMHRRLRRSSERSDMRAEVSLEGLSTFAPDPIFMQKNRALTVEQAMKSIEASTVWSGMKAVKNRQLYLFDNLLAMSWGPNGRSLILEYTLEALTQSKNR